MNRRNHDFQNLSYLKPYRPKEAEYIIKKYAEKLKFERLDEIDEQFLKGFCCAIEMIKELMAEEERRE